VPEPRTYAESPFEINQTAIYSGERDGNRPSPGTGRSAQADRGGLALELGQGALYSLAESTPCLKAAPGRLQRGTTQAWKAPQTQSPPTERKTSTGGRPQGSTGPSLERCKVQHTTAERRVRMATTRKMQDRPAQCDCPSEEHSTTASGLIGTRIGPFSRMLIGRATD